MVLKKALVTEKVILFVCTGNYYRSRFAELLLNEIAVKHKYPIRAFSRGFAPYSPKNVGVISPNTTRYFDLLKIQVADWGMPNKLTEQDLTNADIIVVMDEHEHRPMVREHFPHWEQKLIYWQFEDDYVKSPDEVMPALEAKVRAFVNELIAH